MLPNRATHHNLNADAKEFPPRCNSAAMTDARFWDSNVINDDVSDI